MNRTIAALTACLLATTGCTVNSGVKTTPTFTRATLVNAIPQSVPYTGPKARKTASSATGVAAVSNANRSATVEPTADTMNGATWKITDFDQDRIYRFPVAWLRTAMILLPPGEQLNKVFGGNHDGFNIEGAYAGPRLAISVSPRIPGARGNMQIVTTGGAYSFEPVTRQAGINIIDVGRDDQPNSSSGQFVGAPDLTNCLPLTFGPPNGDATPAWAPAQVCADAVKLAIRFDHPLPVMPALFAGQKGEQMVGYSTMVAGNSQYIVTNRRVTEAQLRLGEEVIEISARATERESEPRSATNTIDPAWLQADALPEKPTGMPTINLVVMPGDGTMPASMFTDKDLFDDVHPVDIDG